jgi:hypothetical protein
MRNGLIHLTCALQMCVNPHIHFDGRGPQQRYEKLSVKRAIIYDQIPELQLRQFFMPAVTQYESNLLMSRLWTRDRFSTLNPLTTAALLRDVHREAQAIVDKSKWTAPAQCVMKAVGLETQDPLRALDFRERNLDAFERYLAALQVMCDSVQAVPVDANFQREVQNLLSQKLQPAISECEAEIRSAVGAARINVGTFSLITLGGVALVLADPTQWSGGAATAIGALGALGGAAAEYWKGHVLRQANPMYFLWKAKKHGLTA